MPGRGSGEPPKGPGAKGAQGCKGGIDRGPGGRTSDAWLHTIFIIGLQNSGRPLGVVFLQEQGCCAQLLPQPLRTRKSLPG